jgi:hypothetical protein
MHLFLEQKSHSNSYAVFCDPEKLTLLIPSHMHLDVLLLTSYLYLVLVNGCVVVAGWLAVTKWL